MFLENMFLGAHKGCGPHTDPRLSAPAIGHHASGPETPSSVLSADWAFKSCSKVF